MAESAIINMSIKLNGLPKGLVKSTIVGNSRNPKAAAKRWENIRNYRFSSIIGKL